jgi:methionyl-tRNA synthetase
VDQTAPFKLAKDPAQSKQLDEVLYNLAETCRVLAVLLWPFLPGTATKIYSQLGLTGVSTLRSRATAEDGPDKFSEAVWGKLKPGHKIGEPAPLFPRKEN